MPCRSDHMEPNAREVESKVVCEHIAWALMTLKRPVPPDVIKARQEYYGNAELVDQHTALLCSIMKDHGGFFQQRLEKGHTPDLLLWLWWKKHQESDKKREAEELAALKQERDDELAELERLLKKYPGNYNG